MAKHSLALISALLVVTATAAKEDELTESPLKQPNEMMGVASFSEVASTNGRITSKGGVTFVPTNRNNIYYPFPQATNVGQMPMTLTRSADGMTSTIQVYPGSISVAASSNSGNRLNMQWPSIPKLMNEVFLQPPIIDTRTFNPWFYNSIIRPPFAVRPNEFRSRWLYPMAPWVSYWR